LDKRKTSVIEKIINTQDLSALSNKRTAIRVVNIKHEDRSILTRGIKHIKLDSDQFKEIKITDIPQDTLASILKNISIMSEKVDDKLIESAIVMASTPPGKTRSQKDADLNKKVTKSVVYVQNPAGSMGTGFVINKEGDIITNYHVIHKKGEVVKEDSVLNGFTEVEIAFEPKRGTNKLKFWPAKIVKVSPAADLALLSLIKKPKNLIPLEFSNNDDVEKGHDAHAIGHPSGGVNWTYTKGLIGQLEFNYYQSIPDSGKLHVKMMIQTSTPIYNGNSGGPLFNNEGKLIGVNTQMLAGHAILKAADIDKAMSNDKNKEDHEVLLDLGNNYDSVNNAVSVDDVKDFIKQKGNRLIVPNEVYAKKYALEFDGRLVVRQDTKKGNTILILVDEDKDGIFEMIVTEDLRKEDARIYRTYDKDGNLIKKSLDTNKNGVVDGWLHYNKDKIKWISYDDDEDGKADRWEKR